MVLLDATGRWLTRTLVPLALEDWDQVSTDVPILLPNSFNPADFKADIKALATIVLEFPKFRDGRAYSQAKVLRDGLGYTGELVASGDLLLDQIPLMLGVGFDLFLARDEAHAARLDPAFLRAPPKRWAIA
jgi:uncharacterized protein (DUF934 family)